jgi:dethiobiotin synthetase
MSPPRFFVTGTDTGVGKTQVAGALLSLMVERGLAPAAWKPYESGIANPSCPEDAEALRRAAGLPDVGEVGLHRFREPLAPGVAAARAGVRTSFAVTLRRFRRFDGRALVVEGAGGLFVPLDARRDVIDLVVATQLPVVLVARAGLGTLNHVALSLEALRRREVPVAAVVLNRSGPQRDLSEKDNPAWIERRHRVCVLGPQAFVADERRRIKALRGLLAPLIDQRSPCRPRHA